MIERFPARVPTRSRTVAAGNFVFTVGVAQNKLPSTYEQAKQALVRINASLAEAGASQKEIVSAIVYLAHMNQKEELNRAWDEWVDQHNPPMRVCVGATLEGEDLVEIVVTAMK